MSLCAEERHFMDKVTVVSKKFDGTLRDEYETYLVSETDEMITLFSPPKLRYWDHRKGAWFETDDGLITLYRIYIDVAPLYAAYSRARGY